MYMYSAVTVPVWLLIFDIMLSVTESNSDKDPDIPPQSNWVLHHTAQLGERARERETVIDSERERENKI